MMNDIQAYCHARWFSQPQGTREAAEALHDPGPLSFEPAVVFKTPNDSYVMGYLRPELEGDARAIPAIEDLLGYEAISTYSGLMGFWKEYSQ
jgi:hypothetical protein